MAGNFPSKPVDTRPVPLYFQGLITGIAIALLPTSIAIWVATGTRGSLTSTFVVLATVAVAGAFGAYLPISRAEALERDHQRRVRAAAARAAAVREQHRPASVSSTPSVPA